MMPSIIKLAIFFAYFLIICGSCGPDESDFEMENKNLSTEGFGAFLQAEMDDQNIPAMSVLIFKEDNILYENYLGQAQIEQQIDLANNQPFLLASVSKVVTAT
ncbi:MAG: CubicO group peptidase (beta-lactamase class C family), partial [Saprospiraceae bacterium]